MFYSSDFKIVIRDLATVLRYIGFLFLVPIIVALIYSEYYLIHIFFITGAFVSLVGYVFSKCFESDKITTFKHALVTVALIWLIVPAMSTIPLLMLKIGFLNAFFETMSAWTTTGLTIIKDVEVMPCTLLFWRSFMQWIGGIGIVVAVLAGLFRTGGTLFLAEGREEKIKPNIINTIKTIWWIYILYTCVGIILLAFRMPIFDSFNHAMTAIATGGMVTKNSNISHFSSLYVEAICMVLMLFGGISFLSHYYLLKGEVKKFLFDIQFKSLVAVLAIAVVILLLLSFIPLRQVLFQAVSAVTATGFSTAGVGGWSNIAKSILILLMIIGGAAGSTAGGLKLLRVNIFIKSIYWRVRELLTPDIIITKKIGERILEDKHITGVLSFILLYIIFLALGTFILIGEGFPVINSFFEVASAQGNVGLSTGITQNATFLSKIVLIGNMWIGRLEIWAVLTLIGAIFIRK